MCHLSFGNRFFRQFIAFFATHQMAMALFRFLGAVLKTMVVANTFGMFVLLIIFIFGGFVIRRSKYAQFSFIFYFSRHKKSIKILSFVWMEK
jgi:ABC-type multidrug transport system permease subunit